jgi:hypothetical protein
MHNEPIGFLPMLNAIPHPLLQPRRLGDLLLPNRRRKSLSTILISPGLVGLDFQLFIRSVLRLLSIPGAMPEGRRMSLRHQSEGSAACA